MNSKQLVATNVSWCKSWLEFVGEKNKYGENELNLNLLANSERSNEVIIAGKYLLLNCVSETNLCTEVPSLNSKTSGKVYKNL